MLALVSVPEGEEEKFLAETDEQGMPFKDMSKRQANAAVKDWNAEVEKNNVLNLEVNRGNAEEYFNNPTVEILSCNVASIESIFFITFGLNRLKKILDEENLGNKKIGRKFHSKLYLL